MTLAVFQSVDSWQIAWKPTGVSLTTNTTDVTKICTAFPKQIYALKLCVHIHDPQWESYTILEEWNSLTSASNNQRWVKLTLTQFKIYFHLHRVNKHSWWIFSTCQANANKWLLAAHPERMNNLWRDSIRPTVFWCLF